MKVKSYVYGILFTSLILVLFGCNSNGNIRQNDKKTDKAHMENKIEKAKKKEDSKSEKDFTKNSKTLNTDDPKIGMIENENSKVIDLSDLSSIKLDGLKYEGDKLKIKKSGTYEFKGKVSEKQIFIDASDDDEIKIILKGVKISNSDFSAIYINRAKSIVISLDKNEENDLTVSGEFSDEDFDSVIFSEVSLIFEGEGKLDISSENGTGIETKYILTVKGGNYNINSSNHAFKGKNSVIIENGKFNLKTGKDGINCENASDFTKGSIIIKNGDFSIVSGEEAFDAVNNVTISGGLINVLNSNEGIEAESIDIKGGKINITSIDDGINASSIDKMEIELGERVSKKIAQESAYISVSGGETVINSGADGVDSNGYFYMSGGKLNILGPSEEGNSAIDYDERAEITGGKIIATGSVKKAQGFSSGSSQASIFIIFSDINRGKIEVIDQNGNVLLKEDHDKDFQSAVISIDAMIKDAIYKVVTDDEIIEVVAE